MSVQVLHSSLLFLLVSGLQVRSLASDCRCLKMAELRVGCSGWSYDSWAVPKGPPTESGVRRLDPEYQALSEEFEGKVVFAKLNVLESHENQQIGFQNGVMGTPTLKFYCGGRTVGESVGYAPKVRLKAWIEDMLANNRECLAQSTPVRLSPYG